MKKTIVFITSDYRIGGRDKAILIIMEALASKFTNYSFELWITRIEKKVEKRIQELRYPEGVEIREFSAKSSLQLSLSILRRFSKCSPRLLFFFSSPFITAPVYAAKLLSCKNIPHVIVDQTYFVLTRGGIKKTIQNKIISLAYKNSIREVANSEVLRSYLIKLFALKPNQTILIHNPILNSDMYNNSLPIEYSALKNNFILLNVGRLHPQKDYQTLLEGFCRIIKEVPQAVLVLVGDGPQKEHVLRLISELKLDDKVLLLGLRENPFPYLEHSDVFVFSSNSEGLPGVLVEAMGLGLPVVATDCPTGPRELLGNNNEYGILVPMKDPVALSQAIISLYNDQSKLSDYMSKGKQRVKKFTEENTKLAYQNLLAEVLYRSDPCER